MSYGLTDEGFIAPRAADLLTLVRSDLETRLAAIGIGTPNYDRDAVYGVVTAMVSTIVGDLGEALQALYDAFTVGNATGLQLDNLCVVVGVRRREATASQATVTLTGTTGTVILAGRLVGGGGSDGKARWATTADVTLAGGTGTVVVECTEDGPTVATAGQIATIITPVSGWTGVTNADAATPGEAWETDAELRVRRQASLQNPGNGSLNALRADLLAISGVTAAVCIDNDDRAAATVSGLSLAANSVAVIVYPDTLTVAQQEAVATTIYGHVKAGIYTNGAQVISTVTGGDGFAKTIRFDYATELGVVAAVVITPKTGFVVADMVSPVRAAIADYFLSLGVGDEANHLALSALIYALGGIRALTLTLDGVEASVTPLITEICVLSGTPSVT